MWDGGSVLYRITICYSWREVNTLAEFSRILAGAPGPSRTSLEEALSSNAQTAENLAEEEGFEPPCESPRKRFSRPPVSTTHPFLRPCLPYILHDILHAAGCAVQPSGAVLLQQQVELRFELIQATDPFFVLHFLGGRHF